MTRFVESRAAKRDARLDGWLLSLLGGIVFSMACSPSVDGTFTSGAGAGGSSSGGQLCVPGTQISCPCSGGTQGVQVCDASGHAYEPCQCGGTGGAGGGSTSSTGTGGASTGSTGTGGPGTGSTGTGGASTSGSGNSGSGGQGGSCNTLPTMDDDGDGYSEAQGDCDDCNPDISPNSVEVIGDTTDPNYQPGDENCNGLVDESNPACDQMLDIASSDAMDAARAVDICKIASPGTTEWGVVTAQWVMADGSPPPPDADFHLGHGMLSGFGPNVTPRAGMRMLGISSGTARQPSDPGYLSPAGFDKGYSGNHPQGFPKESPACPGVITGTPHDSTGVEIEIRAPGNAKGFSFDFDFYTYEWPDYICSQFNDFFVALLSPIPVGQADGQISFDAFGNPFSVNNAFLGVCGCTGGPPCIAGGKTFNCALGTSQLEGTGFMDVNATHAATSWLRTRAPITPGSILKIRWSTYDSGDGILDSTTLIDNWQWLTTAGTTVGTISLKP